MEQEEAIEVLEDDGVGVEGQHTVKLCEVEGKQLGVGVGPGALFGAVLVQDVDGLKFYEVVGLCLLEEACDGGEVLGDLVDFIRVPGGGVKHDSGDN